MAQALAGVRVLDLTRILAGPTCTQLLGDLGADVIKIERPGAGDDTRKWGPPYVQGTDGPTAESAYYLCANRNKRSVAIDIATEAGQALLRRLLAKCDVLVENFKVGDLARYGLDWAQLKGEFPWLVYCSITGFGQTGPYAPRAGYDYLAQGLGGIMSLTGAPDGPPMKVGVGIADLMCGMYATVAILAALRHRDATGHGQHIDAALLDTQVAWLANEATNFLLSGQVPKRQGTEHPNIVPYQTFATADGYVILAVGNDAQFQKWCRFAGASELAADPRFATNSLRVEHRRELYARMPDHMRAKTTAEWVAGLAGHRRPLRTGQHPGPGVRGSPGPGARHADRPAAPRCRRGLGAPGRQPLEDEPDPARLPPRPADIGPAHRPGAGRAAGPGRGRTRGPARGRDDRLSSQRRARKKARRSSADGPAPMPP